MADLIDMTDIIVFYANMIGIGVSVVIASFGLLTFLLKIPFLNKIFVVVWISIVEMATKARTEQINKIENNIIVICERLTQNETNIKELKMDLSNSETARKLHEDNISKRFDHTDGLIEKIIELNK